MYYVKYTDWDRIIYLNNIIKNILKYLRRSGPPLGALPAQGRPPRRRHLCPTIRLRPGIVPKGDADTYYNIITCNTCPQN